jgi:hypothetical protein
VRCLVLKAVSMNKIAFWDIAPFSIAEVDDVSEVRTDTSPWWWWHLWNVDVLQRDYTVQYSRRLSSPSATVELHLPCILMRFLKNSLNIFENYSCLKDGVNFSKISDNHLSPNSILCLPLLTTTFPALLGLHGGGGFGVDLSASQSSHWRVSHLWGVQLLWISAK